VKDLSGNVVQDHQVQHAYTIKGGKIRKMEIQAPPPA